MLAPELEGKDSHPARLESAQVRGQCEQWLRVQALGSGGLGFHPSATTYQLCVLQQSFLSEPEFAHLYEGDKGSYLLELGCRQDGPQREFSTVPGTKY